MNKKRIIIFFLILLSILIGIIVFAMIHNHNINIDQKLIKLKDTVSNSQNINPNLDKQIVILSFTNKTDKAKIIVGKDYSFKEAFNNALNQISTSYPNYKMHWVKFDLITNISSTSSYDFYNMLKKYPKNALIHGIIFKQDNDELILTASEINSNRIINYADYSVNFNYLNEYLEYRYNRKFNLNSMPQNLNLFETISYFCDEQNNIYELYNDTINIGRRKFENLDSYKISNVIEHSTNYLANMITSTGKFIYGYYPITNKQVESYNILRHAGSTWSLIVCNSDTNNNIIKIEKSLEFLNKQIVDKNDNISYVLAGTNDEIKLGGNALSAIAMCEYSEKFNNTKYVDTIKQLGNGIIDMQDSNGGFVHILNSTDYSIKNIYKTVYYDGEATFALVKIYKITQDERYLQAAEKAVKYFIQNDYTKHCDHWISYSVNNIVDNIKDPTFFDFGLKNFTNNIDFISSKDYVSNTNFELLIQTYELYNKALNNNIDILSNFPIENLKSIINEKANLQLSSYMYPEYAMYMKSPNKYYNSFFVRQSNFRIRIDDIQHSVLGYYYYRSNFDNINN